MTSTAKIFVERRQGEQTPYIKAFVSTALEPDFGSVWVTVRGTQVLRHRPPQTEKELGQIWETFVKALDALKVDGEPDGTPVNIDGRFSVLEGQGGIYILDTLRKTAHFTGPGKIQAFGD